MKLKNSELKKIKAGASITGTFINSILNGVKTFMDVGRYLGSSIRRMIGKKYCSF